MRMFKSVILASLIFIFVLTLNCLADELNDSIETLSAIQNGKVLEPQVLNESLELEISGFGDFSHIVQNNINKYGIRQLEIDLEKKLAPKMVIIAAVAYSNESETFELGEFNVDFHLFGSDGDHFHLVSGIDHSGIKVGQFDVPFGLDWRFYPSIDRKTVTGPLVIENTHKGWNDNGVQAFIDNRWFNAVAYGVNGFGYDDVEMKLAVGGRMGLTPNEIIEVGCSQASFLNGNKKIDMSMSGIDLQLNYQALSLKGEYIVHKMNLTENNAIKNSGFYCQAMYGFKKYFYVTRYGAFTETDSGKDSIRRFSNCLGIEIMKDCELRCEYQVNSDDSNASLMQVVVAL